MLSDALASIGSDGHVARDKKRKQLCRRVILNGNVQWQPSVLCAARRMHGLASARSEAAARNGRRERARPRRRRSVSRGSARAACRGRAAARALSAAAAALLSASSSRVITSSDALASAA